MKYTLEDIKEAFDAGVSYAIGCHKDFEQIHPDKEQYIKTISKPKIFIVEVKLGNYRKNSDGEDIGFPDLSQPQIKNNSITILKIL